MIGIFDSGYGGLTIMKEIVAALPQYDYLYLGDNARTPYGNRGKEVVTQYTDEALRFLFEKNCRLIIVACFTASALALRALQEKYLRNPKSPYRPSLSKAKQLIPSQSRATYRDRKILGVIRPVVEKAAQESRVQRIGVVGTQGTVNSGAFEIELKGQKPSLTVLQKACPLLVPLIEEGWHKKPEARMILKKYLRPLKNHNIDTLILGCTHYPLMIDEFKRVMGKRVKVLNSGKIVAESLADYLKRHPEIETQLTRDGIRKFFTTDNAERFKEFAKEFAGMKVEQAEKADLG